METRMRSHGRALAAAGLLLVSVAALAHHGWGSYDASKPVTVQSPVEKLKWENPHVHVDLRHEGAVWEAVLAPRSRMEARGLKPEMLKTGATVTVEGYPAIRGARELRAERITVGGKTV